MSRLLARNVTYYAQPNVGFQGNCGSGWKRTGNVDRISRGGCRQIYEDASRRFRDIGVPHRGRRPGYLSETVSLDCRYHFGDWAVSKLLKLSKDCASPSLDRLSCFVKDGMPSSWHRGHLGFSHPRFCDDRFCQRRDAVEHLPRI